MPLRHTPRRLAAPPVALPAGLGGAVVELSLARAVKMVGDNAVRRRIQPREHAPVVGERERGEHWRHFTIHSLLGKRSEVRELRGVRAEIRRPKPVK